MLVLVICKFDDLIKSEVPIVLTIISPLYVYGRLKASNFQVNSPIWPKIKLIQDFMDVLITFKSDKDSIKRKSMSSGQHFPKSMGPPRVGNCHANSQKWVKFKLVQVW